nr:S-layer homology domain-containing protein [Phosphitispora fastidiosa]
MPANATTYTYDDLNRLISVEYDSGKKVNYTYDSAGNITKITYITKDSSHSSGSSEQIIPVHFNDMTNHWAAQAVAELSGMGIINGYPDGTFKPEREITRVEIIAAVNKALGLQPPLPGDLQTINVQFSDSALIPEWAYESMAAVVREGLIQGNPQQDGTLTLDPSRPITRAEMAALIVSIIEQKIGPVIPAELTFSDADNIPKWAKDAIGIASAKGVITGYTDNTFRAQNNITRAEAASMILRLIKLI